jgi:2-hydroxy-3-keto-5-methylthiopentenyl-1-phosphate phosphatase
MDCHVLVDFDGTIVPCDATDTLLERYAEPSWLDVEREWQAGRMTSRACMASHAGKLMATRDQILQLADSLPIDPGFPVFVDLCRRHDARITVVSEGFDLIVSHVLAKAGLDLPFHANHLTAIDQNRWQLGFPSTSAGCSMQMGNCKCALADEGAGHMRVMVGDGRSDFCIAETAHLVLAKGSLAVHCARKGLPYSEFTRFEEATAELAAWLALGRMARQRAKARPSRPAAGLTRRELHWPA